MILTLLAFVLALALLIAVHEYGHYRVAVACGVKVLRFSIGFGRTLLRWQPKGSPTEFVLGAFPLGGYVRMLDEREAPVPAHERHLAFNTQPLRARVAIVAAGPAANLLLAVLLYAVVNWSGVELPRALLPAPLEGSLAQQAGVVGGELVQQGGFDGEMPQAMESFDDVRWLLTRGALQGRNVRLVLAPRGRTASVEVVLGLHEFVDQEVNERLFRRIGIVAPLTRPVLGQVMAGGAAERAGLREGDLVLRIGPNVVVDGQQLRELIRASVHGPESMSLPWRLERGGSVLELEVRSESRQDKGLWVGKIDAYVGAAPEMVTLQYGPLDGLLRGVERTWEVSLLTVRMLGKMLIGEASVKNLSGPLTIADYAGKSASLGLSQYLVFLALISVSLGVLNLLPLPVLDGGHLMYYLWEGATGKSVSDAWMERLQRAGVALLTVLMSIALFNDVSRLFG